MIPTRSIRQRIILIQKARDSTYRAFNKTESPKLREMLQYATEALAHTQCKLEAELYLLTSNDGKTNCN